MTGSGENGGGGGDGCVEGVGGVGVFLVVMGVLEKWI